MEAAPSPASITTSLVPSLQGPQTPLLIATPGDVSLGSTTKPESAWPRSAQGAAAMLLLLTLSLLGWHVWSAQSGRCRPATLESDVLNSPSIDLNRADHAQLLQLPGVGENLARRIETYRANYHGFRDVDELRRVNGIGPVLLEKMRPFVYVEQDVIEEESEPGHEPSPRTPANASEGKKTLPAGKKKDSLTKRIDVNRATAAELRVLPGIGPVLAERIVATRAGKPFRTVEELRRVKGIGPQKLKALRPHVVIHTAGNEEATPE